MLHHRVLKVRQIVHVQFLTHGNNDFQDNFLTANQVLNCRVGIANKVVKISPALHQHFFNLKFCFSHKD